MPSDMVKWLRAQAEYQLAKERDELGGFADALISTSTVDNLRRSADEFETTLLKLDKLTGQAVVITSQGGCCKICDRAWLTEEPQHLHWCALNTERVVERQEPVIGFRKERSAARFFAPTFSRCAKCGEEYPPGFDHGCE